MTESTADSQQRCFRRYGTRCMWLCLAVALVLLSLVQSWQRVQQHANLTLNDNKDHATSLQVAELQSKLDALNERIRLLLEKNANNSNSNADPPAAETTAAPTTVVPATVEPTTEAPVSSTIRGTPTITTASPSKFPYHVLYGLSGNQTGFLSEFQVSLKSVLLNAPLEEALHVHILADRDAFQALEKTVWKETKLEQWVTRHPITIHVYNVQPLLKTWEEKLVQFFKTAWKEDYGINFSTDDHTIGTMFRLFAHKVLPKHVHKMLYLDPDALLMTNIQELWRQIDEDTLFQWGRSMCAGFMLIDNLRLPQVWSLAELSHMANVSDTTGDGANDQLVFKSVSMSFPDRVGILEKAWDVNVADGAWMYASQFAEHSPQVGMMHFNGGTNSKESAFETHNFLKDDVEPPSMRGTWGMAHYYARMPWDWARYWASSKVTTTSWEGDEGDGATKRSGFPVTIVRHKTGKKR
ncbi:Glycosyl transferase family 8 [Seminavis robusta]|uniref:Glycosyl transferase family 8 n=1 Tax=Seminavis robusta TaxID=568900 RepID=A0A9N8E4H7_9STRA|nr:Glycosyl transferase family 8 [Seminavis robusta]|eukprot:Sro492_g153900.1 Glycosyl transferase family 8 (467) ;mRNA; f:39450-40850